VSAEVRSPATLTDAELRHVASVMVAEGVDLSGELRCRLIAGGRSNLTFKLSDDRSAWVLRTPPRVGRTPSAHDVAREFRVTAALAAPRVPGGAAVGRCAGESLVGGPFAIAEYVDGRTLQTRSDLEALTDGELSLVVDDLLGTLARLHAVDHVAAGLERFGRPDGYSERQVRRWVGQWDMVGEDRLRGLATEVIDGLRERLPEQRATGIVHGDFRIDNTLLTTAGTPEVAAVVDWELSTIGDPAADVAMMCAYRAPAFDLIVGAPAAWTSPRLPSVEDLADRYVRAGGVALDDFASHLAIAYFKIAVIAAGIAERTRVGAASGAGFDTAHQAVEPFLDLAQVSLRTVRTGGR
jgi:aminoglycoside phosphotransferase (APT) family kinase protein